MSLNFFKIPYKKNDLEPFLSSETLTFHHEKHHKTYFDNLQNLIKGSELENKSLEEIIIISSSDEKLKSVYNNAAQVFNHDFYFRSLKRENNPSDYFINLINKNFGSWNNFLEEFKKKSLSQFGSGWVWLVLNNDKLEIISTSNADNPLILGLKPLMTIDVWEHAYYIDYRNLRGDYVSGLLNNLIDWSFVEQNLS
ncbi:MAG TPA: superoxide dismutase [bacterium]|nr:superoxide dismutase [bacterium]HPV65350.1 superoxide dismutase [bacterium]